MVPPPYTVREALTRQLALGRRERHVTRRQARESNSLIYVLPGAGTSLLYSGCSPLSDLLIHGKSDLHVICEPVFIREDDAKCRSIFDSLTRSLGLMRLIMSQSFIRRVGVDVTHQHWVCSVTHNACLAHVPMVVRSVHIQPPGHAINRVPKQAGTIGIQLVIVALQNLFHWNLLELEPFLVMFG
jgi:hypothetical protein